MNNLTVNQKPTPFSFLTINPPKSYSANGCGLAWIKNSFHLAGNNYYLYACHSGNKHLQISKGIPAQEIINWGGQNV